jgi:GNAT superfamily N-acetyltransferase
MLGTEAVTLTGEATLIASWGALARLSAGARLERRTATLAAVFPNWLPLNNAILLDPPGSAAAAAADLRELFDDAGVDSWALWLPSSGTGFAAPDTVREVEGMQRDTTSLVMKLEIARWLPRDPRVVRTSVAAAAVASDEPVPSRELPGPSAEGDMDGWVLVQDNAAVAGAWSHLHGTDCGVYAVGTVPAWRRRGLARALMQHVLADAANRGARTATLQSTPMGERLYRRLGFAPVGRYEEWVPRRQS